MKYIGLIGDVINSKKIKSEDRILFQKGLVEDLSRFNRKYPNKIGSKLVVTLGDEFQGLLFDAKVAFEVMTYLQVKYNHKMRFGLGVGEIYTDINFEQAIGTDGPVWWNARKSLDEIKKAKDKKTNILVHGIKNTQVEELINYALVFVYTTTSRWNNNQKNVLEQIIYTYGLCNKFKQIEFANKSGIEPSKVNRVLKSSKFFDYVDIVNSISNLLKEEVQRYD